MANKTSMKYSPEVRERAVRLVFEHQGERAPQWAVIGSITAKTGCTAETLRDRTISVMKGAYPGLVHGCGGCLDE